ncbi:hypothetical protein ACNKHS_06515 [Shigella flexneri]
MNKLRGVYTGWYVADGCAKRDHGAAQVTNVHVPVWSAELATHSLLAPAGYTGMFATFVNS